MTTPDYTILDTPEIGRNSFYPRRHWTAPPPGAADYALPVADGIALSCRFFPAGRDCPTLLFFYGNGETAADYDGIAPAYNQIGVNFFSADYRGYGQSAGQPAFTPMLADAHKVRAELTQILTAGGYGGPLFVMGRSMGRHPAFELAANSPAGALAGLIIESGRPTLGQFCYGLPPDVAAGLETAYRDKIRAIALPVLVIHGEQDTVAPVEQAREMFDDFPSPQKRLLTLPGAGHNDLLYRGGREYFAAIREFVGA